LLLASPPTPLYLRSMGLRFRRRIRIAPGLRLNLSKSGPGISLGGPGASLSFGPQGPHIHAGIPGTGIHYREKLPRRGGRRPARGPADPGGASGRPPQGGAFPGGLRVALDDDARVRILDGDDRPLPDDLAGRIRRAHREEIRAWLVRQCEHWNQGIDEILSPHLSTPPPEPPPTFHPTPFERPRPVPPDPRSPGLLGRILSSRAEQIEEENQGALLSWEEEVAKWEKVRAHFRREEARRRDRFERGRFEDVAVMEELLGEAMRALRWPRETEICFEVRSEGELVLLDVDLPPRSEMPTHEARPATRQYRVLVEERSDRQRRLEYSRHIHGVLFRVAGEVFHQLPRTRSVVASGFTQWPDGATGGVRDDYLVSARIARSRWSDIHFDNLAALDLPKAFERFELRREMSATDIFQPIDPFSG
jgi:hypothetical protein